MSNDIQSALSQIETIIRQTMLNSDWEEVCDEDGNPNVPSDEREVLVFLSGYQSLTAKREFDDQGWGIRLGWYDSEKGYWRVHGQLEKYATHWRDLPPMPETAK